LKSKCVVDQEKQLVKTILTNETSGADATAAIDMLTEVTDKALEQINALTPPESDKDLHGKLVQELTILKNEFLPVSPKLIALKGSSDIDAKDAVISVLNSATRKVSAIERELESLVR